ncbi:Na(+)-translocating NADH-quinone reductase subunit A [Spirochaetota bacterium]|nr:Na(+)-translocating NADH-quinone reductase subunit A [Spirochaetota bacterium]
MGTFAIKKGLDIPLVGKPVAIIEQAAAVSTVGVVALDYKNIKPRLLVAENEEVQIGTPLFEDKVSGVLFTAPGGGTVKAIHRGAKRKLLALEIALAEVEEHRPSFPTLAINDIKGLASSVIRDRLNEAGCWAVIRERPFGGIADMKATPRSIFVTATDTDPLGSHPSHVIAVNEKAFVCGLHVLAQLTPGYVHVCRAKNSDIPHAENERVQQHVFTGKHPAGLVGTHIHFIDPIATTDDRVWHVGYQDVIKIGKLFLTGKIFVERYVALGGTEVAHPRMLKTRIGANLNDLVKRELTVAGYEAEKNRSTLASRPVPVKTASKDSQASEQSDFRIVSGSPLAGRKVEPGVHFLGAYANAVAVLKEDRGRYFQDFMRPGANKFSLKAVFVSGLFKNKRFAIGTSTHGSHRAVVPIGAYEEVLPLNILATPLIKALLVKDLEAAEQLGALELDGEDLALCTFVCPGKNNISDALEEVLGALYQEKS